MEGNTKEYKRKVEKRLRERKREIRRDGDRENKGEKDWRAGH